MQRAPWPVIHVQSTWVYRDSSDAMDCQPYSVCVLLSGTNFSFLSAQPQIQSSTSTAQLDGILGRDLYANA